MTEPGDVQASWDFDAWADTYDASVARDPRIYARYDDVLSAVAEIAVTSHGARVLDIGTGTGNLALHCAERGAEVIGLDPSESMLAVAKAKTPAGVGIELNRVDEPFLHIPYPCGHFDAVVSTYAYHHVPPAQKPATLSEMLRVLGPGGQWVIGDLAFADEAAERAALAEYQWLEDEYFARVDELGALLGDLGVELHARQFTPVTWAMWAAKPSASG